MSMGNAILVLLFDDVGWASGNKLLNIGLLTSEKTNSDNHKSALLTSELANLG